MKLAISIELSLYEYVFQEMGFEEIYGPTFCANAGVLKLHQICGSRIEKIVEGEVEKEGVKYDVAHMTISKSEWEGNREKYKYQKIDLQ